MNSKISVFIITLNEELIIEKCLEKLHWVDEIVVVDSGSSDQTVAICEKYKAKIFHKKFSGFGEQKQYALEQTTNDWVLSLDADEVLTDALIEEIKEQLELKSLEFVGFYLKRRMVFADKIFNYGAESSRETLRFFNKKYGIISPVTVHETIIVEGKTKKLENYCLHYTCLSLETYINKINKYTSYYAENKFKKNKKYSILEITLKMILDFVKKYLLELNFLNGKAGYYWSYISSVYTGIKCIKTNEKYFLNN